MNSLITQRRILHGTDHDGNMAIKAVPTTDKEKSLSTLFPSPHPFFKG